MVAMAARPHFDPDSDEALELAVRLLPLVLARPISARLGALVAVLTVQLSELGAGSEVIERLHELVDRALDELDGDPEDEVTS